MKLGDEIVPSFLLYKKVIWRMDMKFIKKIFGDMNEKEIKRISQRVDVIEGLAEEMRGLTDEALKAKTAEFKERLSKGETLDDLLIEAFAVVREASVRVIGNYHYRVQLIGGVVLHEGRIAEMKTGEGKTMVALLPAYLNALEGKGVHVITVNDYLAKRDCDWMGKVHQFLGLTVGCVIHGVQGQDRVDQYNADITYGTNNEFGFDYLRDNMVIRKESMVQRPLNYAIIDEVDSILVDEARTPLIISGAGVKSTELYRFADTFVKNLVFDEDYTLDEKAKSSILTDEGGVVKAEKFFNIDNLSDPEHMEINHHINQALRARFLMKRDVDYVVKEGEILIVDEFTGRLMQGRRFSNGLHQAIEAKENLEVRKESQTLATITLQNYFRMYQKLSGMTGTAKTEEDEFRHIYNMDVVVIPTNKPVVRDDRPDSIYRNLEGKFRAVIEDIKRSNEKGQPVLVGTISIETSELLSQLLKRAGIKHEVLNAKQHEREAEIVAQAGRFNAVTIATNMAGRGTDIVLGGNPEYLAKQDLHKKGYDDHVIALATSPLHYDIEEVIEAKKIFNEQYMKHEVVTSEEADRVKAAGGLHIIGTERHESRRIDNQLRGRSGRQGDAGSSQFFISFEDDLMRLFISDRAKDMVGRLGLEDDMPLEHAMLTRSVEGAQSKVEARNFGIRKHVLQYDDVMNRQREIIYAERSKVLQGEDVKSNVLTMLKGAVDEFVVPYTQAGKYPEDWDLAGISDHIKVLYSFEDTLVIDENELETVEDLTGQVYDFCVNAYTAKEAEVGEERMRDIERFVLLRTVDTHWIDHIDAMDQLKQGVGMRAVGNEDPVRAYQIEGFDMFNEMIASIQRETIRYCFGATIQTQTENKQVAVATNENKGEGAQKKPVKTGKKVGRNDPCPCGSGKKYKKCCGQ